MLALWNINKTTRGSSRRENSLLLLQGRRSSHIKSDNLSYSDINETPTRVKSVDEYDDDLERPSLL